MQFRTKIKLDNSSFIIPSINHQTKITCLGSCFAQHIGDKLAFHKMDILCNPTGIIYNPISLSKSIIDATKNLQVLEENFFEQQGRWVNYDYHSEYSQSTMAATTSAINKQLNNLSHQLLTSDLLILSIGTAFVFDLKSENKVVNNCHKMPSNIFHRRLLTVDEIIHHLSKMIEQLLLVNPKIKILTTISPVRHTRDGLVENNRSKSTLNVALHQLIDKYKILQYFPAFEILMDDLRDYRFYNTDMIHPSQQAVDYIWDIFSDRYFTPQTIQLNEQLASIQSAVDHKPFHPHSSQHQAFRTKTLNKIKALQQQHPYIELQKEKSHFK